VSYKTFFDFSAGLTKTLKVPVGTKESIINHIKTVEAALKIEREKYRDCPEHWKRNDYTDIPDKTLCETAIEHNTWTMWLYDRMIAWAEKEPEVFEEMTNEDFQNYLPALRSITVPAERWTGDYYTRRMEVLYEVMRGRETEGITFDVKKLTQKQASQVINLFSEFLDRHDRRLAVPKDFDYLASSYDGGYEWCEKCGPITYEHSLECKRRGCPLKKEYAEDEKNKTIQA
jgi:hypothetical protein